MISKGSQIFCAFPAEGVSLLTSPEQTPINPSLRCARERCNLKANRGQVTDLTCPRPLDLQTTLECHPIPHFGGVWSEEEWTSIDHQVETR